MKNKIFWEKAITQLLHRNFATDPAGEKMKPLSTLFSAHAVKLLAALGSAILISSAVIYVHAISTTGKRIAMLGGVLAAVLIVGSIMMYRRRKV